MTIKQQRMNSADIKRTEQRAVNVERQARQNRNAAQWREAAQLWRLAGDEARAVYCEGWADDCEKAKK